MRTLSVKDLDLESKKALIRVDFNVPFDKTGAISDDTRIVASLPTIQYVLNAGGSCILMSHLGRPKGQNRKENQKYTLAPCAERLSKLLHRNVIMAPDCIGQQVEEMCASLKPGQVVLLENVRFHEAEEKPELDPSFAKQLAKLADVYINDAFGSAHRAHSSTTTVAQYFPEKAASGFLMEKEIEFLGMSLKNPKRPFQAIIGGAKVSTKIGVIEALMQKADALFIGGAMGYTFLKAQGISIGHSLSEDNMVQKAKEIIASAKAKNITFFLPEDTVCTTTLEPNAIIKTVVTQNGIPPEFQGVDIGEKTISRWTEEFKKAKTILWNGPVGIFEDSRFAHGTMALANALADLRGVTTIIGGGDSACAVQQAGCASRISHISTGGGASLEYIEFGTLPGVDVLSHIE